MIKLISKGELKYVSAVKEVRVVDMAATHYSDPMTVYLTDKCQLSGTHCIFSANKKRVSISCSTKNVICEGLAELALLCGMSNDHIAAKAKKEELIPVVYGIHHVAKALTNHILAQSDDTIVSPTMK